MSEEHDLETTEETSAPAEMLDTEDRAYDLLFNQQESETEDAVSAENDVTEEDDSSAENVEATEEAEAPQDAEETEASEEDSVEGEEDPEGISIPDSFRDIKRDSLQTDEGRAVYDALSQAYKAMEADYTRKSQAVSGAENVLLEKEDAMREIFKQGNVANPSHEQMLDTAVSEFIALRTDADYAQTLYEQLGNVLGIEPGEEPADNLSDDDPRKELEQFKNEVRSELQAREEQEEVERLTQQLHTEWEDTVSNEEFKDFSEEDWKFVLSAWSAAEEDSSAYAHAKALKARYDAIAESKAKEAEEKQREYLKKKAQQPKVGAGSEGQNAQPTTPKPKNWDEADDLASKMLGL